MKRVAGHLRVARRADRNKPTRIKGQSRGIWLFGLVGRVNVKSFQNSPKMLHQKEQNNKDHGLARFLAMPSPFCFLLTTTQPFLLVLSHKLAATGAKQKVAQPNPKLLKLSQEHSSEGRVGLILTSS